MKEIEKIVEEEFKDELNAIKMPISNNSRPEEMPTYSFDIILKTCWINFSPTL